MRLRKWLWKLHSVMGLIAAVGLLLIGLSGTLLVLHEDIDRWLFPESTRVEHVRSTGKLPWSQRVKAVEQALPGHAITGWAFHLEDASAAEGVYVMPWGTREWHFLTADPYTGKILSGPIKSDKTFKQFILRLHYSLLLGDVGMLVTGLLGVMLCLLGISGLWIYRRFWKLIFRMRWIAGARLVWGNVHRLTGVLSVMTNLILGFTGAFWNLSHLAEDLWKPHTDPADEAIFHERLYPADFDLDGILVEGATTIAGFEPHYVSLPWAPNGQFTLWGRTQDAPWFRSRYGSQVSFSANNAQLLRVHDIRKDKLWDQIKDAFEPLHFGSFGGLPIKLAYAFAGMAPGILAISGITIWWFRKRGKRDR